MRWESWSSPICKSRNYLQNAAFVRGSWKLTMSDGKTPHGLFTLVFRKFPDGWKIIHDHSSAEE